MRFLAVVLVFGLCCSAPASAQSLAFAQPNANLVATSDPADYVKNLDDRISQHGMAALRDTFTSMFGEVPPQMSQIMLFYEGYVGHDPARVSQVLDDVSLSGRIRMIYSLHIFGPHKLLFTRADFVRIDDANWAMNGVAFGSSWAQVAALTTPGFTETTRPQ